MVAHFHNTHTKTTAKNVAMQYDIPLISKNIVVMESNVCIWALPVRGGEGVNASDNLSGILEVWITRTLQKLTHFHNL